MSDTCSSCGCPNSDGIYSGHSIDRCLCNLRRRIEALEQRDKNPREEWTEARVRAAANKFIDDNGWSPDAMPELVNFARVLGVIGSEK